MNHIQVKIAAALTAALTLWVMVSAGGALTPFVLGAVIAYISAPMSTFLEKRRASQTLAAALIVVFWLLILITLPLSLLPLLIYQIKEISQLLPIIADKVQAFFGDDIVGWFQAQGFGAESLDVQSAQKAINFLISLGGQGVDLAASAFTILLVTPLALFYFLRDRHQLAAAVAEIFPPRIRARALPIAADLDRVLGEFLHGQLLVMVIMATLFSALLFVAQLKFALIIGVISGILVFIPYVGFGLGLALATLIGIGEYDSWAQLLVLWALMIAGTTAESLFITPRLVGERVGMHPLLVLLALFLMGGLFGFIGVLIALPAAAVALVCCRHLRLAYIRSDFYKQE